MGFVKTVFEIYELNSTLKNSWERPWFELHDEFRQAHGFLNWDTIEPN
jgi:hypothetical protein